VCEGKAAVEVAPSPKFHAYFDGVAPETFAVKSTFKGVAPEAGLKAMETTGVEVKAGRLAARIVVLFSREPGAAVKYVMGDSTI
jgi:hypothetical protein